MALGVFNIVSQSSDTAEKVTLEDQEFVQIVGALKKIDRDFSSIYSPLYFSPPMGVAQELTEMIIIKDLMNFLQIKNIRSMTFTMGRLKMVTQSQQYFMKKNTEIIFSPRPTRESMRTKKNPILAG